jgi:hypothetical protein
LRILEKLVADDPAKFWNQNVLGGTLGDTAELLAEMGRHAESLDAYRRAAAVHRSLHKGSPRVGEYRKRLSDHLHGLAALERKLQDHAAAVETSLECRALWPKEPTELFAIARELASCVPLVGRGKAELSAEETNVRQRYAGLAMETLVQAVERGYKNVEVLRSATELGPLRDREDFKKVLASVEAQSESRGK